ncbi:hypothetical protein M9H77_26997 [Catharanthus roseus]|uniref:Uncharacterized protein n=1 Tax=Catharanthus roseus TaxID=4058 RepID=A0ACC0AC43_CATRO|nr:hypothetical protein M9H77_26997 [Catharanthus roseus]
MAWFVYKETTFKSFLSPFVEEEDNLAHFATYRGPRKYRCHPDAPPKGWIKLNMGGIDAHGDNPAGYGGICRDESNKTVLSYNCFLDKNADESAACMKALLHGFEELLEKQESRNLIVEGDTLKEGSGVKGLYYSTGRIPLWMIGTVTSITVIGSNSSRSPRVRSTRPLRNEQICSLFSCQNPRKKFRIGAKRREYSRCLKDYMELKTFHPSLEIGCLKNAIIAFGFFPQLVAPV